MFLLALMLGCSPAQPLPSGRMLVADGDSITFGYGASDEGSRSYPGILRYGCPAPVVNLGVSGSRLAGVGLSAPVPPMVDTAASRVDPLYKPGGEVLLLAGTNDLGGGADAETVIRAVDRYCSERRTIGWTVWVLTILPRATQFTAQNEADRQTVNQHILALSDCRPIDVASDPALASLGPNYLADGIHPNDAGYYALALDVANAVGLPTPARF